MLGGLDALLSIVQMPTGVPVACVGINNARNAALLAIEILSLSDSVLIEKMQDYRKRQAVRTPTPRA
jgi:5-(carboxyamino)imidazole ribonucleotide mutase